jgi:hypothetical protein
MFNGSFNLNFTSTNLQSIDDIIIYDINQFQSFPSYSSINNIPEIKEEGKIYSKDNNITPKFKIKIDDNLSFTEYNKFNITKIYKGENISINKERKTVSVDGLEQLKSEYLNKKNFSENNLGRKRRNNTSYGKHTKFSEDNLQRKCINIVINNTLEFINKRIKKIYNGNIGNGMNCKKLNNVKMYSKPNFYTVNFTKNLLHKTLGEIFSDNISLKYTNYLADYNSLTIKKLLNEEDQDKRMYLEKLFGITFIQCVKKFAGIYNCEELDGFITFNEYKDKLNQDPEYFRVLKDYLINFEENIRRKKPKEKNKNKVN